MPTPIREQIIAAAQTRLGTLTPDGCLRCEPYSDEPTFIAIWDQEESAEAGAFNKTRFTLPLAVVYSMKYTKTDSPAKANEMLANIIVALHTPNDDLGGLAESVSYVGSTIKHRESGSDFISVGAVFDVIYHTRNGDPFTQ